MSPAAVLEAPVEPVVNDELMIYVYAYIATHPEEWDQTLWRRCKTAFCFAGHVTNVSGVKWAIPYPFAAINTRSHLRSDEERKLVELWDAYAHLVRRPKGFKGEVYDIFLPDRVTPIKGVECSNVAEQLLGASFSSGRYSSNDLFNGNNSLADLRRIIARICKITVSEMKSRAQAVADAEGWGSIPVKAVKSVFEDHA